MPFATPDLVVLLPGITGSVLTQHGKVVWGYSGRLLGTGLLSGGASLREALTLVGDSADVDVDLGDGVVAERLMPDLHMLPGLWKIDGYSKVREVVGERLRPTPGENYFEFAYDWRRDNRIAAERLARKAHDWLADWRRESPDAQLILLAHSMGGLVARYFLECLGGWKETRALITFGTPFRGSLNALDTLANGMKMGPLDLVHLSEMARSFTSLYQLLPIYPAYDQGAGLVRVGETVGIPEVDPVKASAALEFHDRILSDVEANRRDPAWQEQGYGLYPIVGTEQRTMQTGRRLGEGVEMSYTYEGKEIGGDGTVPRASAIPRELRAGDMYAATRHGSLQNSDAVLTHLTARIEDLYLDLGRFRGLATSGASLSLELEDLVFSDEPISVRARSSQPDAPLTATLYAPDSSSPPESLVLEPGNGGWQGGAFAPRDEGYYRVQVTGDAVAHPAEDTVAVARSGIEPA